MPNFDGGHYFLTALIPISTALVTGSTGTIISPIQKIRNALATLPTARQTPATEATGLNSPFSRNLRTHFARFVVVEDVTYNGRDPVDAIEMALRAQFFGANPVTPQHQDKLEPCPYLIFIADFDAASGAESELLSYLELLWKTMAEELTEVLAPCVGFSEVSDATDFARYIQRCQIETTMPFNDYWTVAPPLKSYGALLLGTVGLMTLVGVALAWCVHGGIWISLGILVGGLIAGAAAAIALVMCLGPRPFPAAPNSDLPSVLKALYLQQHFTKLVVELQGADDVEIHRQFGRFIADHSPSKPTPTQLPGVVHS